MPSTLSEASETTTAPTPFEARSSTTSLRVRCGWVVKTSRPLSARMRATVIVLSPFRAVSCRAAAEAGRCARNWARSSPFLKANLTQASVDEEALLGDHRAVVRGEEQRQARHVLGHERAIDALAGAEIGDVLFAHPQPALPLGDHGARRDGVDANVVGAEFARQALRQADDRRLGGGIGGEPRDPDHPCGRGKIDDRAAAEFSHRPARDLGGEELMLEI